MSNKDVLYEAKREYTLKAIQFVNEQIKIFKDLVKKYEENKLAFDIFCKKNQANESDTFLTQLHQKIDDLIELSTSLHQLYVDIYHALNDIKQFNQRGMIKVYPSLSYLESYYKKDEQGKFYSRHMQAALEHLRPKVNDLLNQERNLEWLVTNSSRMHWTIFIVGEVIIGAILLSILAASIFFAPELSMIVLGVMLAFGAITIGLLHIGKSEQESSDWCHDIVDEALTEEEWATKVSSISMFSSENKNNQKLETVEEVSTSDEEDNNMPSEYAYNDEVMSSSWTLSATV